MYESFDQNSEINSKGLVRRFEHMMSSDSSCFFDADDFEVIIDYYLDHHKLVKCQEAIDSALEQHPANLSFSIMQAKVYLLSNQSEKALELLKNIEKIEPSNTDILLTKGNIFSQLKQYRKAIDEY
ncbi:MAG: hypothetical protein U9R60_17110, partial [Bacteroidota bacterium]|nr:hypothetical protein [Bacteroidota bacterium]